MPNKQPEEKKKPKTDEPAKKTTLVVELAAPAPKKAKKAKLGGAAILNCSCNSSYQDRLYGRGCRVFTTGAKGRVCTSCGSKR